MEFLKRKGGAEREKADFTSAFVCQSKREKP